MAQDDKWIKGGTTKTTVMNPVVDFSSSAKKQDTNNVSSDGWTKGGSFNTNEFLDINQTIGEVAKAQEEFTQKNLNSEDSKKNRLTEIEQEINSEKLKQQKIASQPLDQSPMGPGNDIQRRTDITTATEKIKILSNEKNRLTSDLKPVTPEERKDVLDNSGMDLFPGGSIKEYDLIQKYGPRYNKIKTDVISEKMDLIKKEKIKNPSLDNMLSYANVIHGKMPELKYTDEKTLSGVYDTITKDPEWNKSNYAEKRKLIDKGVSEFISKLEFPKTAEGVNTTKLKQDLIQNILPKFVQDSKGNPTIEGIKLYIEDQLEDVNTMIKYNEQTLNNAGLPTANLAMVEPDELNKIEKLSLEHGRENIQSWYQGTRKDLSYLRSTSNELARLLKMPEYHGFLRDIGKAVKTTDLGDLLSIGIKDMVQSFGISGIAKKIEEGTSLTYNEQKRIETFASLNYINSLGTQGRTFKAITGGINMIPYIAQFALSGGITAGIKGGLELAAEGVTKGFGAKAIKIGSKRLTMATIGAKSLAAGAQTLAIPQMYLKNINDLARNNISLVTDPEINKLTAQVEPGTGLPLSKAIPRGAWNAYSEIFTERIGEYAMAGLGGVGKKIMGANGRQMLNNIALSEFMKMKGITATKDIVKGFRDVTKIGGLMEEYSEEFINYWMEGISHPKDLNLPVGKNAGQYWSDQLDTFLTLAVGIGAPRIAELGLQHTIGRNVKMQGKYGDGTDFSVKIPRTLMNDVANVFSESKGLIGKEGSDKINTILSQWEGKLDHDQERFLVSHIVTLGQEKMNQMVVEKTTGKDFLSQINDSQDVIQPSTKLAQDNLLKFSKEERKDIEEENKRVTELHPDLAKNNLLIEDPGTGQKIEPDKQSTKKLLDQVNRLIAEKVEFDKFGNPTNVTPEVTQLLNQQSVLEDYNQKFIDRKTSFKDLSVPEKNEIIQSDLKSGKELTGVPSFVTDRRFEIKLDDGRIVSAYYDAGMDQKTKAEVNKAIIDNEPVSLKINEWENWNPDAKITDKNGVPYWDKIDVMKGDKVIGSVEVTDFKADQSKKLQQEQVNQKVINIENKRTDELNNKNEDGTTGDRHWNSTTEFEEQQKQINAKYDTELAGLKEKSKDLKTREAEAVKNLGDAFANLADQVAKKTGAKVELYSDEDKQALLKAVLGAVKALGDYTAIQIEKLIDTLKKAIANTVGISQAEKNAYYDIIDANQEKIIDYYTKLRLKQQGLSRKMPVLSLSDLVMPEFEGVTMSGAQKVDAFLNGYAPIWRTIATEVESSKDNVEKIFYKIARLKTFQNEVKDEAQYRHFISTLKGQDLITDKIAEMLDKSSYDSAVSLFDFYSNVRLIKQFGLLVQKKGMSMKLLNPPERFDEFIDSFWSAIKRYGYKGDIGYDAIYKRLIAHSEERNTRFNTFGNKSYTWYEQQTPEVREQLRREQHESDILLLSELTGISTSIWNEYFTDQTKETFAKMTIDAGNKANFGTYDNLLKHDTFRSNYHRIQSDIAFNLSLLPGKFPLPEEFEGAFVDFFTKGNEETGTLSNLYKLSTATKEQDDIALRGVDIKGDRFSSMIQSNMLFAIADKIRNLPIGNNLTAFYYDRGKNAEISILNGIHNTEDNKDKKGTPSLNMSFEDLWTAQLYQFFQEGDSYQAWMGQFGDKPALEFIEVPKYKLPEIGTEEHERSINNPDFDVIVKWILDEFINHNQSLFNLFIPSLPSGLTDKEKFEGRKQSRIDIARSFVYNFSRNMKDIIEVFHGDIAAYENDLTAIVKRGGSSNSPGYHLNTNIEGGVGESFQFALVNDELIPKDEIFDGVEFMTGEWATRAQKSMGITLSKADQPGMEYLSSMKALHTTIHPESNLRGLTKGNLLNIELLAEVFPGSKFSDIRDFMKKNKIDRLSFTSTTKLYEYAKGKKAKKAIAIQLWDKDGKKLSKPIIPENSIITRNTADTYVQQDLRHSSTAKAAKMSSQLLANMLILPHGKVIAGLLNSMQNITINDMIAEFKDKRIDEGKLEWLMENVNQNTQADIYRLLEAGMTPYEPSLVNFMRKMIAAQVTRKALEIPISRITTQEIPDTGLLKGRKLTSDGKYILLPEISSNVEGARYAETDFIGKPADAINHVKMNHDKYRDLFDMNDNLREWEITERNGEIPGEMIISTRTPADDLHSHTVGRLKYKLIGNFTMLDKESQKRSGSDFDGDQRFNWVFFKDKHGKLPLFSTKEGLANQMLMQIAEDYMDPRMDEKISEPINTHMYDDLVNRLRGQQEKFSYLDPRAHNRAREENMTGVRMKGIMTDVVTTYSLIHEKNIPFKKTINIPYGEEEVELSKTDKENIAELKGFNGYVGGFEDKGKGTESGDGKDKAMRKIADAGFIGEVDLTSGKPSSTLTSFNVLSPGSTLAMTDLGQEVGNKKATLTALRPDGNTVMLARNGRFAGQPLNEKTKSQILGAKMLGKDFVVGDMPQGDTAFIEYLQEIGAEFSIYHTGNESRIKIEEQKKTAKVRKSISLTGIVADPKGLMKIHLANLLNMAFDNAADPKIEIMGLNEVTAMMYVTSLFGDRSVNTQDHKSIHDHIEKVSTYFTSPLVRDFVTMMRRDNGGLRSSDMKAVKEILGQTYNSDDVKQLLNFYSNAKELSEVRRFYSLTQKAPSTVVEFQTDKQLYEKVRTNQFQFLDVKNLFDKTGHPIQEFAISEKVLQLAEDIIYSDSFEYSSTGREIYKAIYNELKKKDSKRKFMTSDELKSLSYGMNTIAAIRAIGNKQSMDSLYKELTSNIKNLKDKYPNNTFLKTIGKVIRKGKPYIEILTDYQRGSIGEVKLAQIRNDFDRLASMDPALADKFVSYALLRWGPTTSTWRGSYYNLIGDDYRVMLSKKTQNELYNWQVSDLSPNEKLQITELILRGSRQQLLREMSETNPAIPSSYDYNSMATIDTSMSYDDVYGLDEVTNETFEDYAKNHNFDTQSLISYVEQKTGTKKIRAWAKTVISSFDEKAQRLFPVNTSSNSTVKDMLPQNAIGELLATDDVPLQDFIFDHLRKAYPGVQMFTDHQAFVDFVMKFGDRGFDIDPEAIGHAFANARYLDPTSAVQSSEFHEHSHIYWDALPEGNKTKQRLRDLFKEQFTSGSQDDIDEEIILEIGRAGVDIASIKLRGDLLDRFVQLLKQFWIDVKSFFGIANLGDLVQKMAWKVWENTDNIVPDTNYGKALMRNMVTFNNKSENLSFSGDTHTYFIGKDPIPSVTQVIVHAQNEKFDPNTKANQTVIKFQNVYKRLTGESIKEEAAEMLDVWDNTAEKGTVMHAIAESVFGSQRIITSDERAEFTDVNVYYDLVSQLEDLKKYYAVRYPGIIWYTEQQTISKKFKIGGTVDLVADIGDNKLVIFDFKTTDHEFADDKMVANEEYKKIYSLFLPPFQSLPQSKYNIHMLQTNMYANMLEEQEDPEQPGKKNIVDAIRIVPIIRSFEEGSRKIKSAVVAKNLAKIPRNENTIDLAERMMALNYLRRGNLIDMSAMRENLLKTGIARHLINDTIVAYSFFKQSNPLLKDLNREHIESFRGKELGALKINSITRGFTIKDLYGNKSNDLMPFEILFFANALNLRSDVVAANMDTYFPEQEVSARYTPVLNPKATERRWSHMNHEGRDMFLHEVGSETISEGDEIMMVYDIQRPSGKTPRDIYYYIVESVNKKKKTATVKNEQTGNVSIIPLAAEKSGAYKIYSEMPLVDSKNILIVPVEKNSFIPRFLYEKQSTMERHFDYSKIPGAKIDVGRTEAQNSKYNNDLYKMRVFFNEINTLEKMEEWANDKERVNNFYAQIGGVDTNISKFIMEFVREISINNFFAEEIAKENNFEGVPTQPLPITLNTYYLFTNHPDAVWQDWKNMSGIRDYMPQGLVENRYTPLTTFTTLAEYANRDYQEEVYLLNKLMKEFIGKIDYDLATVTLDDGELLWRRPYEKALDGEDVINSFLFRLYEFYERLDPQMAANKEAGLFRRIPVANVYLSRSEAVEKWGSKWGTTLHKKLKPSNADGVKLTIMAYNNKGKLEPAVDRLGNRTVKTLGEIKQDLAMQNYSPDELRDYLGPKWQHIMSVIPGTSNSAGQLALLNYYINQADNIYQGSGKLDTSNVGINTGTVLKSNRKVIPVIGHKKSNYSTDNYLAAEIKSIDSMLKRFHTKKLMAPLDWMVSMYQSDPDAPHKKITDYLQVWGDYILYGKKPDNVNETASHIIDAFNRWSSYVNIMFGVKGQVMNLAIGQGFDLIREPQMYLKGIGRLYGSLFKLDGKAVKKTWNLAKRFGIMNMANDMTFDMLEKEYKVAGIDINKIENVGYKIMELAEKGNQFPILAGFMSDEEWDAYDKDANIIHRRDAMTEYRKGLMIYKIQSIHGHYSTISMAPSFVTNQGKLLMQYRKWIPTYLWSQIAPYHIDKNQMIRSGVYPALHLAAKWVLYNSSGIAKRQAKLLEILDTKEKKGGYADAEFFNTTNEYFDTLIDEFNGNKISFQSLSESDKKNLGYAIGQLALLAGSAVLINVLTQGSDDPDKYKKLGLRNLIPLLSRFQGDMLWMYSGSNWKYMKDNLIPALTMVINAAKFATQLMQYIYAKLIDPSTLPQAVYMKDTITADKGTPKFLISGTYIIGGGSGLRWAIQKGNVYKKKHQIIDLKEMGMKQQTLDQIGIPDGAISRFDLEQYAYQYGQVYQVMKKSMQLNALLKKDFDPNIYFDLVLGKNLLNQERNQLSDAITMMKMNQMFSDGKFVETFREMKENAREWDKYQNSKRGFRDKVIKKKLYENVPQK